MITAVQTNGEGMRTTAHLNLANTLADVWGVKVMPVIVEPVKHAPKRVRPKAHKSARRPFKPQSRKIPFAGYDRSEQPFKWLKEAAKGAV